MQTMQTMQSLPTINSYKDLINFNNSLPKASQVLDIERVSYAKNIITVNGETIGVSVFPHRGTDEWNNWGWSNPVVTNLKKGKQVITLEFDDHVENMNITVNQALLDQIRLTKVK